MSVALNIGPRYGTSSSLACMNTEFGIKSVRVAFHGFILLIALWICSLVVDVYAHFSCTLMLSVSGAGGANLLGKKAW